MHETAPFLILRRSKLPKLPATAPQKEEHAVFFCKLTFLKHF